MKLDTYKISSAMRRIESGVVTFPVYLEVQTTSTKIEQYCMKNFPTLIVFHEFSMEEMYQLAKMKTYIKSNLTASDKKDIIDVFITKGWLNNAITVYDFKILECRCRMAADKIPFLLINAEISFNIKSLMKYYVSQNWLSIVHTGNNITKETAELYFSQPLPYMLIFERSSEIQAQMLQVISELLRSGPLAKQFDKAVGLEKASTLKKQITWGTDKQIKIVIDDAVGLLKLKAKKNWVPLTFAAIIAADKMSKKKKKELLTKQLNVFEKMQELVAVAKEDEII